MTFEFWLPVREVLGYYIPIIPKKEHTEDQIWYSGILDKSTGQVISATIGRITFSYDIIDDGSDRLLQYYCSTTWRMMIVCQRQRLSYLTT
jgi:hypothetical protein